MTKTVVLALLVALSGCFAACHSNTVNTVSNAGVNAKITRINDKRVDTDSRLAKKLCLTEIRQSETNDEHMRIQIYLKNLTKSTYTFIYRFNWYDDKGTEVDNPDNDNWTKETILGGDDVTLTSIAPQKNCRDFKLRLKAVE